MQLYQSSQKEFERKLEMEGNVFNVIKGIYEKKPMVYIIVNGETLNSFSCKIWNKIRIKHIQIKKRSKNILIYRYDDLSRKPDGICKGC